MFSYIFLFMSCFFFAVLFKWSIMFRWSHYHISNTTITGHFSIFPYYVDFLYLWKAYLARNFRSFLFSVIHVLIFSMYLRIQGSSNRDKNVVLALIFKLHFHTDTDFEPAGFHQVPATCGAHLFSVYQWDCRQCYLFSSIIYSHNF